MSGAASPLAVAIPSIAQLTDNAARLLQQSLAEAAQALGPASVGAVDLELARSNVRALGFVQGMGLHGAYRYLRDYIARQAVPIKSAALFLDGWLATYGMARKAATAATGAVGGTGVNGSVLPAGTLLQTATGRQFRTTAAATVAAGVLAPPVVALVEGAAGNLAAGTALSLLSPVVGIDSAFAAAAGLAGGADLETDAQAVSRLQQRLSYEPMGGCPADYARWALQVPGITRAWGVRCPGGPGTAGVVIMADAAGTSGVPSLAQQAAVLDYIRDPLRGPPDELFVILPTAVPLALTIALVPDSPAQRLAVVDALDDLFFREAFPGEGIPHNHVVEAVSAVVGEYNHTISSPPISSGGMFTVPDYGHILVRGTVTWL